MKIFACEQIMSFKQIQIREVLLVGSFLLENLTERFTGGDSIDLRTGIQKFNISAKKIREKLLPV